MTVVPIVRERVKWMLFPGLNLHARLRNRRLSRELGTAQNGELRVILDAGCGNGMLTYQGYLRGNHAVGVSIKSGEVERNRRLFHDFLGVPEDRLSFEQKNLYELVPLTTLFDEIICTEVLEHIADDRRVCETFWKLLKPGGVLHLCCPNADHPDHRGRPLDKEEKGGHVRSGYTVESYRQLLEPIGFRLEAVAGLGGPVRQWCNRVITEAQLVAGLPLGLLSFLFFSPLCILDASDPKVPYSLYVRAAKP